MGKYHNGKLKSIEELARMRERVTVVCHFFILEKAPFSGLKLTSVYSRRRFKSFKCSTFLKIEAIFEKKRVELLP